MVLSTLPKKERFVSLCTTTVEVVDGSKLNSPFLFQGSVWFVLPGQLQKHCNPREEEPLSPVCRYERLMRSAQKHNKSLFQRAVGVATSLGERL